MGPLLTIVQNFTPIGRRISKILHKKGKKTSAVKHKSAPKAIASRRTN